MTASGKNRDQKFHRQSTYLFLSLCLAFGLVVAIFSRPVWGAQADFEAYLEVVENSLDRDGQLVVDVYLASDHAQAPAAAQVDFSYEGLILKEAETGLENGMASGDAGQARVSFMVNQADFDGSGDLHMATYIFMPDPASEGDAGLAISYAVAVVDSAEASVIYDINQLVVLESGKTVQGNDGKNRTGRLADPDHSSLRQTDGVKLEEDSQAEEDRASEAAGQGQTDGQAAKADGEAGSDEAETGSDTGAQADSSADPEAKEQLTAGQDAGSQGEKMASRYAWPVLAIVAVVIVAAVLFGRIRKKKKQKNE